MTFRLVYDSRRVPPSNNHSERGSYLVQGGLDPNKISDLGADFGIIVR